MYRLSGESLEVLLVHPGGPFWKNKDAGAWTFPRGTLEQDEELLAAATREFKEETGLDSSEPYLYLGQVRQRSGKLVHAWAFQGNRDPSTVRSNTFDLEWPPKSGKRQQFPEIDRAAFFPVVEASGRMRTSEMPFLERLRKALQM
jgi:predicted NUDIX family NTP pyrophosphohydrolase